MPDLEWSCIQTWAKCTLPVEKDSTAVSQRTSELDDNAPETQTPEIELIYQVFNQLKRLNSSIITGVDLRGDLRGVVSTHHFTSLQLTDILRRRSSQLIFCTARVFKEWPMFMSGGWSIQWSSPSFIDFAKEDNDIIYLLNCLLCVMHKSFQREAYGDKIIRVWELIPVFLFRFLWWLCLKDLDPFMLECYQTSLVTSIEC